MTNVTLTMLNEAIKKAEDKMKLLFENRIKNLEEMLESEKKKNIEMERKNKSLEERIILSETKISSGGGVAIYVNSQLYSYEFIDSCLIKSKMEQIWVVISILSEKYLVGCIYKQPDFTDMQDFGEVFRKIRDYANRKCFKDILIMGDFNYPKVGQME